MKFTIKIMVGALLSSCALPLSYTQSIVDEQEHVYSAVDLSTMSKSQSVRTAVSFLTGTANGTGAPVLELDEIKHIIDTKDAADLRAALLLAATAEKGKRKTKGDKDIADFARVVNPTATCGTEDSAGGLGLDLCMDVCEGDINLLNKKAACYMLCSLAIAPCTTESFSIMAKSWATSWMRMVETTVGKLSTWTMVKTVNSILLSCKMKMFFLVLVYLAARYSIHLKSLEVEDQMRKTARKQLFAGDKERRQTFIMLNKIRKRQIRQQALHRWHDVTAWATYRAAQERAAEGAAMAQEDAAGAVMAEAVARQAAREAWVAEQDAARVSAAAGSGFCVIS